MNFVNLHYRKLGGKSGELNPYTLSLPYDSLSKKLGVEIELTGIYLVEVYAFICDHIHGANA